MLKEMGLKRNSLGPEEKISSRTKFEDLRFCIKHDKLGIEVGQDCDWVRLGWTPV